MLLKQERVKSKVERYNQAGGLINLLVWFLIFVE
jgi:hypothetical protein